MEGSKDGNDGNDETSFSFENAQKEVLKPTQRENPKTQQKTLSRSDKKDPLGEDPERHRWQWIFSIS